MDGKSMYNQAFGVVDYCKDIEKNRNYSEYFSPNNIRRLIISPDTVLAQFYISVPNVGKEKAVNIPSGMLNQVEILEDYVPIVQIISTERICSSIEEIVFVTFSNDGRVQLGGKEYAFESLIRNFNNKSGDLLETIKKRYVRLHDIILFKGSFNQFRQLEQANNDRKNLISEWKGIKESSEIKFIHNDADWYTKWGSPAAAKTYPRMDGEGGHLYKHFANYIAYMKKQSEAAGLEAFKKERYGAIAEEFKKEFDIFSKLTKMSVKLQKYIDAYGFTANIQHNWKGYAKPQFYKCDLLGDYPKQIDMENGGSEGDLYKKNKEIAHKAISGLIYNLSENYIGALMIMSMRYPDTCKVLLKDRNTAIIVPDNLTFDALSLEGEIGCTLRGSSPKASAINVCWFTSLLLLNKSAEDFNTKITTREYWEDLVK